MSTASPKQSWWVFHSRCCLRKSQFGKTWCTAVRGCRLHLFNRVEMENSFRERQRRKEIEKKTQKGERPCFWKHLMKKILYFVTAAVVVAVSSSSSSPSSKMSSPSSKTSSSLTQRKFSKRKIFYLSWFIRADSRLGAWKDIWSEGFIKITPTVQRILFCWRCVWQTGRWSFPETSDCRYFV